MPIPPLVVAAGVALLGVLALADQTVSGIRRAQRGPARSHVAKVDPAVACPACERGMRKVTFHGVEIDECPFCAGQWFDAGEIETISQMDPDTEEVLYIQLSMHQLKELSAALNLPEGVYRIRPTGKDQSS